MKAEPSRRLWKKDVCYSEHFPIKSLYYICYLCLSIATSIKPTAAHHQQESSQLFLIGNERRANYNFVDREKDKYQREMFLLFSLITTLLLQLGPKLNAT